LSFWGISRVIERFLHKPDQVQEAESWDFKLQSEPTLHRLTLRPFKGGVMGASDRVDKASPGWQPALVSTLTNVLGQAPAYVENWQAWANEVSKHSPGLLLGIVHTSPNRNNGAQDMIIGQDDRLNALTVRAAHVRDPRSNPSPLVLLIGCETGAPDLSFYSLATAFRRRGAGIVVATGSTILAKEAPNVAGLLIEKLRDRLKGGDGCFGEVMRDVRRSLLAQGNLIAMCLMAFGDADWHLVGN
jgi:hypothetical protein